MPFALVLIGLALLISGVRNTQDDLFTLVKGDFSGSQSFVFWTVSILVIGSVGYIPRLKPVANAFLVLVIVVLFLSNRGFFAKFNEQIGAGAGAGTDLSGEIPALPKLQIFN